MSLNTLNKFITITLPYFIIHKEKMAAAIPRMPESRRVVSRNPELVFQKVNEILVQSSNLYRDPSSKLIQLNSSLSPLNVPLKTRQIEQWPTRTEACCLHCSEPCPATPLPAVHFFDPVSSAYWLSGFFCRPCCSLAYIQNDSQFNSDRTRCNMWTREVLMKFFKMNSTTAAPPRAALKKFGGPLTLAEFYGEDTYCTRFVEVHAAPFVSFAMYAEVMQTQTKPKQDKNNKDNNNKDMSSDATLMEDGIRQPLLRTDPIALQECTAQPSLLVKYLTKLALTSSLTENEREEKEEVLRREKKGKATEKEKEKKEKEKEKDKENKTRKGKIDEMDDPQKSIHSKYLATSSANSANSANSDADDQIVAKKVRKPRVSKNNSEDQEVSKAPKNVLKRAKKMEMQDAAMGNKTRSLLSYAQKT